MIKDLEPGLQLGSATSQSYDLDKALELSVSQFFHLREVISVPTSLGAWE